MSSKRAKVYWTITCSRHGSTDAQNPTGPRIVKVGPPRSKSDRRERGCPACRRERAHSESDAATPTEET